MDKLERILSTLSHLDLDNQIVDKQSHASGLGGSCDVYSAWSLKHKKRVAVKQIRAFLVKDLSFAKKLAKEIRIWATLEHPNILPFLGFFVEGGNAMPSLVSEWMIHGTLFDFMKTFSRASLTSCDLLLGIADGLDYLHSRAVIHADLKSQNILISKNEKPLLADFGLSLTLLKSTSAITTTGASTKGTVRWMARDLLVLSDAGSSTKHDEKTDVWAFGMVIYEMLSWKVPYWDKSSDVFVLLSIVNGLLPERPQDLPKSGLNDALWALCQRCWLGRTYRPSVTEISVALIGITESQMESEKYTIKGRIRHYADHGVLSGTYMADAVPFDNGHDCTAWVRDGKLNFACEAGAVVCPIIFMHKLGRAPAHFVIMGFVDHRRSFQDHRELLDDISAAYTHNLWVLDSSQDRDWDKVLNELDISRRRGPADIPRVFDRHRNIFLGVQGPAHNLQHSGLEDSTHEIPPTSRNNPRSRPPRRRHKKRARKYRSPEGDEIDGN